MVADKYEVVISGMSGKFPDCFGSVELEKHLMNKTNLVREDPTGWKDEDVNVPLYVGKVEGSTLFDMTSFGIHRKLCQIMDPLARFSLERAYEAICDAGVHPNDLWGSDTAVLMASMISETEYGCVMSTKNLGHAMLGHSRTMQANRLSYFLNLQGPSLALDCSWIGGLQGLQIAKQLIAEGSVKSAIVGACNLLFRPELSMHYVGLGRLAPDGQTKCFSEDANGYARSEACVVFFLQRAEDAKRSYGSVLNVHVSNYGFKDMPYCECSSDNYEKLIKKMYEEANIDVNEVGYIEADGCGSKITDAMELNAFDKIICKNRTKPLYVGSIKSNLGHTEATSSLVSVFKALMALNTGVIPPNINYNSPNPLVPALESGKIQVVTEPTPLEGSIVGVSSIGVVGAYAHIVFKQNPKVKSRVLSKAALPPDGIPRLVMMSGREEDGLKKAFKTIEELPIDEEYTGLINSLFKREFTNHLYRGYTLLHSNFTADRLVKPHSGGKKREIWFIFSGMGSQWSGMGKVLMGLPIFAKAIEKCQAVLKPKGVDVIDIITNPDPAMFDTILHSFVGIAAIQIGLVDVLKALGITPDGIVGHSVGELGCAYADGCFTAEQMILSAYARGRASIETELIRGMMAAVGKGYNQIKNELPPGIEVACHNSADSCTLSGPTQEMEEYIAKIKSQGIFAKLVNVANIAYHSKHIAPAAPTLLKYLKEVIPEPKPRSKKWISSSVPKDKWDTDLAMFSSAEYHTNNLLSSVLFEEASSHIPRGAITIEIAPHGLLQAILRRSLVTCTNIALTNKAEKDSLKFLMSSLGKLYVEGVDLDIAALYPKIEFPVSRATPPIHNLITWEHSEEWIIEVSIKEKYIIPGSGFLDVEVGNEQFKNLEEHQIFNRVISPISLFMNLIKNKFNESRKDVISSQVTFQNVKVHDFLEVALKASEEVYFMLNKGTGIFEVCHGETLLLNGKLNECPDTIFPQARSPGKSNFDATLSQEEVYKYLEQIGLKQGPYFRVIQQMNLGEKAISAIVRWSGEWVPFLNGIFTIVTLKDSKEHNKLRVLSEIKDILIDYNKFHSNETKDLEVNFDLITGVISCPGLCMKNFQTSSPNIVPLLTSAIKCSSQQFLPYDKSEFESFQDLWKASCDMVIDNFSFQKSNKVTVIKMIGDKTTNPKFDDLLLTLKEYSWLEVEQMELDTRNLSPHLDVMNKDNWLIICESIAYPEAVNLLKSANPGILVIYGPKNSLSYTTNCTMWPVFKTKSADTELILFKKATVQKDFKNVEPITNEDPLWETTLSQKLKEANERENPEPVFLILVKESLSQVHMMLSKLNKLPNYEYLRVVCFIGHCPSMSLSYPNYQEQLKKDMKINILCNGEWGTVLSVPLPFEDTYSAIPKQPILDISNIRCPNVDIKALGLNLPDITRSHPSKKLGVFSFSGIDSKGNNIFGLATLLDTHTLVVDPVLCWPKPKGWTHQQACTVPLVYSLAYYIMKVDSAGKTTERVLIHDGMLPVSQAIMEVASSMNSEIFVTANKDEKPLIRSSFPQIKENHILDTHPKTFYHQVKTLTNSKGVNILVNTLKDEKSLHASLSCLQNMAFFYQLSRHVMKTKTAMGMLVFLEEACVHGVTAKNIINLSEEKKLKIKNELANGMVKGEVKPSQHKVLGGSMTSIEASRLIQHETDKTKQFVYSFDNSSLKSEHSTYMCHSSNSYLIVGGQQGTWFDVAQWLVSKGATKIYVALKKHALTGNFDQRMSSLLNLYPAVSINFLSLASLVGRTGLATLKTIHSKAPISTAIVLGVNMEEYAKELNNTLKYLSSDCELICIGTGGELVTEQREKQGLPTLAIQCDISPNTVNAAVSMVEELEVMPQNTRPVVLLDEIESNVADKEFLSFQMVHLPEGLNGLKDFYHDLRPSPVFEEVTTLSMRFENSREVPPLFLIPGTDPSTLNPLISKLFYPTFLAHYPTVIESVESIAEVLAQELIKFNLGAYTIVGSDCGGCVALEVTKILEKHNKRVCLVLLDGSPYKIQAGVREIICDNGCGLIDRYITLSPKVYKEVMRAEDWESKLTHSLEGFNLQGLDMEESFKKGITGVHSYLKAVLEYESENLKIESKIHLFMPNGSREADKCKLDQISKKPVKVHVCDANNSKNMISDKKVIEQLNTLMVMEYKDAANKGLEEKYDGANILFDAKHQSVGLVRA